MKWYQRLLIGVKGCHDSARSSTRRDRDGEAPLPLTWVIAAGAGAPAQ